MQRIVKATKSLFLAFASIVGASAPAFAVPASVPPPSPASVVRDSSPASHTSADEHFLRAMRELAAGRRDSALALFAAARGCAASDWLPLIAAKACMASDDTGAAAVWLDSASRSSRPRIVFEAASASADLNAASRGVYGAVRPLLEFVDDRAFGDKAAMKAGGILLKHGDTAGAVQVWSELLSLHPTSSNAHVALLKIVELADDMESKDPYELLKMSECAFHHEDFVTASRLLKSLERRRVDRRLRDDILLLHGDALFRLSDYKEALVIYRDASIASNEPVGREKAEMGLALCRLYLGDSVSRDEALQKIARQRLESRLGDTIEMFASLMRCRGDSVGHEKLLRVLSWPTFESFIVTFRRTVADSSSTGIGKWREVLAIAERLREPFDRALALSLLAERSPLSSADLRLQVIQSGADDYLVRRASSSVRASVVRTERGRREREADSLMNAVAKKIADGESEEAIGMTRCLRIGYRGTPASAEADGIFERSIAPYLLAAPAEEKSLAAARLLIEAGALAEALAELEGRDDPSAALLRIEAMERADRWHESVEEAERMIGRVPWRVSLHDLDSDFVRRLFPPPYAELFRNAAESYVVPAESLRALALVQSRFDPLHKSGYRIGLCGMDVDAVAYARHFPAAPKIEPHDLLDPASSIRFAAWMMKHTAESIGDSTPYRLAAALFIGPPNLPSDSSLSELEWIAELPFRTSRIFALKFLEAEERYRAMERPRR